MDRPQESCPGPLVLYITNKNILRKNEMRRRDDNFMMCLQKEMETW